MPAGLFFSKPSEFLMQHPFICLTLGSALALSGAVATAAEKAKAAASPANTAAASAPAAAIKLVDINSASRAELKTLPGIGDAEAGRIIKARPYPSKAKLVADKVLPDATYAGLTGRIVAIPKAQPPQPKAKP